MVGQDFRCLFSRSVMETHSWEAAHQVSVKFLIVLDAYVFDTWWHPISKDASERACSWAILDDDIPRFESNLVNHGLPELAGARPDRADSPGSSDEA